MIRVFVADDHEVVRHGVADIVAHEPDMAVVGEADTARRALVRISATQPDVVLLDMRFPDGDGIEVCRQIHSTQPETRCIIFTAFDDDEAMLAAVLAGAYGYIMKTVHGNHLVDGIRRVARGDNLLPPEILQGARGVVAEGGPHRAEPPLTLREHQVLHLIADGRTNRQIGERLGLAEKTVKNYVSRLLDKLGMEHRTQAAVYAVNHGERVRTGAEDSVRH